MKAAAKLLFNNGWTADQIADKLGVSLRQVYFWIGQWKKENYFKSTDNLKYHTIQYKTWRLACLKRDRYTCRLCGKRARQVDHIKPWATNPSLRYDVNNGRSLCISCHRKQPTTRTYKRLNKN